MKHGQCDEQFVLPSGYKVFPISCTGSLELSTSTSSTSNLEHHQVTKSVIRANCKTYQILKHPYHASSPRSPPRRVRQPQPQPQHRLNNPTHNTSQRFYQQVKRRCSEYAIQRMVLPMWSTFEPAERALCSHLPMRT